MKIEWSPRAERELTELRDYIAQDSPFYARQFTEHLVLAVERLTFLPRSGRIVYRVRDEQQLVQIVTVLHGARDLAGMEPSRQPPAPKS